MIETWLFIIYVYNFSFIEFTLQFQQQNLIQAGAELGQAQLKLELDFTLIFFRFGLIELTGLYSCS